jgi:2-iminobutanoate/2-iminopropanoate deaminase
MTPPRTVLPPPRKELDIAATFGDPASMMVRGGDFIFVGGLTAVDPHTGARVRGSAASEASQILANLDEMLRSAGSSLERVVKVNVLLASILDAPDVNEMFERTFPGPPPARTMCGARLPDGVKVIIECTALA